MSDPLALPIHMDETRQSERRDAVENRAKVLAAAEPLFAERGVAEVTMTDIARAAHVGKGTLYRRFADKSELCLALMDAQMLQFQEKTLADLRQMTADGVGQVAQLSAFLRALVFFTADHAPLLAEVQRERLSAESSSRERPHFWQYLTVHGLLQAAAAAGELRPGLDLAYLADALLAPLHAGLFRYQIEERNFSLERIAEGLQQIVAGLVA